MTDLLFNYYFYPLAFGLDGAMETRTVKQSRAYTRVRRIGGPVSSSITRKAYTLRVLPTYRSNGYDTGKQFFAIDGDHRWNFEVGGRVTEFRVWLKKVADGGNLKRTLQIVTATGVGSASVPLLTVSP
jgi:hypothetical protein